MWSFVGLSAQQIGEDVALVGRELALVARRIENSGALVNGNRTQILKRTLDHLLAIGRQRHEATPRIANLHLFLWRHALEHLTACQPPLALAGRHLIQIVKLLHEPLLLRLRQAVEAGIVAQETLLVLNRKALVLVKPCA